MPDVVALVFLDRLIGARGRCPQCHRHYLIYRHPDWMGVRCCATGEVRVVRNAAPVTPVCHTCAVEVVIVAEAAALTTAGYVMALSSRRSAYYANN